MKNKTATTYSLLINSEDKDQSFFENFVYLVLIATAVFSVWQAALQPIILPTAAVQQKQNAAIAQTAESQLPRV
jgi:hypothetical protein